MFEIRRCEIQYFIFMEHFSRSVDSSRGQSLQITVNVWDQIAHTVTLTSRGLKHRDLSASTENFTSPFVTIILHYFLLRLLMLNMLMLVAIILAKRTNTKNRFRPLTPPPTPRMSRKTIWVWPRAFKGRILVKKKRRQRHNFEAETFMFLFLEITKGKS